ncbi:MAG: endonuclease [Bacteroidales bacterium]|nr:endonuclease [Bacteroidales bacterium]
MRRIIYILLVLGWGLGFSQIPNGYYDNAQGLTGDNLRTALYNIIKNHNQESYNGLWTDFQTTDVKSNGKVWDMYSTRSDGTANYEFTFVSDQCGNYSGEGTCYNREHSVPASWFDDDYPMYSDLFHLYPTDGYVNNRRSNYPFGEVGSATWTSTNGSKLGSSNYPGYSGTVFEPIDEFKGDFARSYFYMLTCYMPNISSWSSDMLSGDNFSTWAKNMLLEWNELDPVSQKEIDRNNAVYGIQNNRNPYIDHPEWAVAVWDPNAFNVIKDVKTSFQFWYSNQTANWNYTQPISTLEIYNVLGQKVDVEEHLNNNGSVSIPLKKGVYIARFKSDQIYVLKFVVK